MSFIKNVAKKLPKYNPDMKFLAPDNRAFLMVSSISVVLFVLVFIFIFSDEDTESKKKSIMLDSIDGRAKTSNVDAQVSDLYKQSIQELNKENYDKASKNISGAAMPVLYHDKPDTKAASIEGCGCTFDATAREALIEELRKLGITDINKSDGLRLGQSDVYVQTDGTIIDQTGNPYLWDGDEIRTSDTGVVLHSQSGMPIETSDGQSIHLSKDGKFYNDVTAIIRLMGRMLSSDGVILLGNGYKAHRPGGMSQVNDTDIYITTDRQLATMDAKPVFNGSSTVFKDMENRLHDYYGKNIKWEDRTAFQQNDGKLTGRAGEKFSRIGILISHGGILIDNDSMLTDELNDIKRFSDSDLYVNSQNMLVDSYGQEITYQNYNVKVGVNNILNSEIGPVLNSSGSQVSINNSGRLVADRPVFLTGTLKDSQKVAFDRFGHRISRQGKLLQLAESAIWHTADRYLATEDGQSLLFNGADVFQDIRRFKRIDSLDAYGLKTNQGVVIRDLLGQEVFLNERGQLIYDNGLKITESGILTTSQGVIITSDGELIIGSDGFKPVLSGHGEQIYYKGRKVYQGKDGRLYDSKGNLLLSPSGQAMTLLDDGLVVDEDGNVVEGVLSKLAPITDNIGFEVGSENQLLDKNGRQIYYKGKKVFRGSDGRLYDEDGALLKGKNGQPLSLNSKGQIITPDGQLASMEDFAVDEKILVPLSQNKGFIVDKHNELRDKNGNQIYYNGKKVKRGADGRLYDENGTLLTDKNGQPLSLNSKGQIVTPDGQLASIDGFEVEQNPLEGITDNEGFKTGSNGELLTKSGNQVYYNGKKVKQGADGSLFDEDGTLLTDKNGQPLSLNSKGQIVTPDGLLASIDGLATKPSTFNDINGNEGFKLGKGGELLDKDGNQVYYKGKKVIRGADGRLYDETGELLKDKNGQPLSLNSKGQIVTPDGQAASLDGFAVDSVTFSPVKNKGFKTGKNNELLDENGNQVYFNGKKVIRGADGRLYDEGGTLLTDKNGQPLSLNSKGQIVTPDGQLASVAGFETKNMLLKPASENKGMYRATDGSLLDDNGNQVYYKGKKVLVGDDGRLYDTEGVLITGDDGQTLRLNDKGEIVTPSGRAITLRDFEVEERKLIPITGNSGFRIDKNNELRDKNGHQVYYNGKKVRRGADGRLYDEDGTLLTDKNGQPLSLNSKGQIVTPDGKLAGLDNFGIKDLSSKANLLDKKLSKISANKGFRIGNDNTLLDENGHQVYYKGKKVKRGADGRLYDEDGTLLTDKNGQPLSLNSKGQIVTPDGELATLEGFEFESKLGRELLKTGSDNQLEQLGESGIFSTKDGLLVDKNGKSITYKGKRLRRGKNGQLFDENGNAVLDQDGNPIHMNDKGDLVDVNGNPVEGVLLQNGDGQYLYGGAYGPAVRRIGNSDIYMTREGLLTDDQGKPITFNGKPVKIGEGGRLYTTDGVAVTDAEGNVVALTNNGELKNRSGMPAKGAVLQDGEGVSLDPQGLRVTNGGKLTSIGNGLYKTAGGLLVDRLGKPVLIEGKQAFVNDNNEIVDANDYPLRYQGRRLNLTNTGALIDAQGNPILEDGQAVIITSKGFTKEDGTLIEIPEVLPPEERDANSKLKEFIAEQKQQIDEPNRNSSKSDTANQVDEEPSYSEKDSEVELAKILDVSTLTDKEITRLNRRYLAIYQSMEQKLSEYDGAFKERPSSSVATFSQPVNSETITNSGSSSSNPEQSLVNANTTNSDIASASRGDLLKIQSGTVLYGANQMTVNTDLDSRVVFNLMGLPHTHPLYRGTAQGVVALKYDHIVIAVTSLCPEKSECYPVQALAVDPTTRSASVNGDIDKHYWYRFGGLTFASLIQGAAIAVGESRDRTDTYDEEGKVVSYSGLDGKELMIRATEPLGESLASVFMENVNRPYTGNIAYGEEVGIFLFEDVVIKSGTEK